MIKLLQIQNILLIRITLAHVKTVIQNCKRRANWKNLVVYILQSISFCKNRQKVKAIFKPLEDFWSWLKTDNCFSMLLKLAVMLFALIQQTAMD